tara:strand:+ start:121133 stop:122164 length:1032 start_codon:yes stop_codon:yes gene_type:complete
VSASAPKNDAAKPGGYAESRRLEREAARQRIHEHVLHPIDTPSLLRDPLFHPTSPIDSTIGSLKLLFTAIAVHGCIILIFAAVNDLMGEKADFKPQERVTVRVIESLPPPPLPLPIEEEVVEEVIEAPLPPDFVPKDPTPPKPSVTEPNPKKPRVIKKPDPAPTPPDPAVPPPRRRIAGLGLSSTTTGGKGPSFATGSTRMGETETTAVDPDIAKQEPEGDEGTAQGKGSSTGKTATREQRTASNIPTRDSVFVKPKREKPSKPPYPTVLKAQGIEGDVQVRVTIDTKGNVTKVAILKGSGHKAFDDAAERAAKVETFSAATRDGSPVPYTLSYSYRFRIEEN